MLVGCFVSRLDFHFIMSDNEKQICEDLKEINLQISELEQEIAAELREVLQSVPDPEADPEIISFDGYTYIMNGHGFFVPPYMMENHYPRFVRQIHEEEGNFNPEVWMKDASKKPACINWDYEAKKPGVLTIVTNRHNSDDDDSEESLK
ncbi:hypothetical protein L596_004307 [Steinernema carpocapsae]|uniref:Uncharacterized protein n=2 Tax=Steinernema carpocapsae TaxID=34508 RepID=A0A4U8UVE7_STECR|nr:hypothetical protein L596_004307 [Steinernema carpocapsae]